MKRCLVLCALLCLGVRAPARCEQSAALPDAVALYYIYDNLCGSCEDATEAFDAIAARDLAPLADETPYVLHRINVFSKAGRAQYGALVDALGLDAEQITLPALIAGGRVFEGEEAIERNLREAFLVAAEDLYTYGRVYIPGARKTGVRLFEDYAAPDDAVTVVYFYRITCDECNEAAPVIDGLPDTIPAADGGAAPVQVLRINTRSGNNGERIAAFFDAYGVPDEDRMVPIAFTRDAYFAGFAAIGAGLADALAHTAPGFVFPGPQDAG